MSAAREASRGVLVKLKYDLPLTLEEAAPWLFEWDYQTLRTNFKALRARGLPAFKEGRRWLMYPSHVRAWRAARYSVDARRALRLGGFDVQTRQI